MTTKGANLTDPRHNIPTVAVFLPVVGKEGRRVGEGRRRKDVSRSRITSANKTTVTTLTHGVTSTSIACPLRWDLSHFNVTRDSGRVQGEIEFLRSQVPSSTSKYRCHSKYIYSSFLYCKSTVTANNKQGSINKGSLLL